VDFSLDGGARKGLRHAHHRARQAGLEFELLPSGAVEALLPELRRISDAWLEGKHTREKEFSVGYFDEVYLRRFPLAVVRCAGRIVAFANVLCGARRAELSIDLMRALPDAPYGVMEYMFVELMLWGRDQGYAGFNLGMAPLSDEHVRAADQLWNRFGSFVFHYGEHFYNFKGVRAFKEQFRPRWSAKYIALESGLMLPRVATDIAALISGGYRGMVSR
jgi:phosphatidylglycerol lysyltransferase